MNGHRHSHEVEKGASTSKQVAELLAELTGEGKLHWQRIGVPGRYVADHNSRKIVVRLIGPVGRVKVHESCYSYSSMDRKVGKSLYFRPGVANHVAIARALRRHLAAERRNKRERALVEREHALKSMLR